MFSEPPVQWVRGLSGGKCGRGMLLNTHPLLAPRSWKSRAIPLLPSGPQPCLERGYFTLPLWLVTVEAGEVSGIFILL
jgi:hypothetical protein